MRRRFLGPILFSAAVFSLAGCLGDRLAGGSGVGNPTKGSVTLALMAGEPGAAAAKASAALATSWTSNAAARSWSTTTRRSSGSASATRIRVVVVEEGLWGMTMPRRVMRFTDRARATRRPGLNPLNT